MACDQCYPWLNRKECLSEKTKIKNQQEDMDKCNATTWKSYKVYKCIDVRCQMVPREWNMHTEHWETNYTVYLALYPLLCRMKSTEKPTFREDCKNIVN